MDDPAPVGVVEPVQRLAEQAERPAHRQPPLAVQERLERLALDELHDHVQVVAVAVERVQRRDVGVEQPRQRPRLLSEPLDVLGRGGDVGAEGLDGDGPVEHQVEAAVDGAHAALAQERLDPVRSDDAADHDATWAVSRGAGRGARVLARTTATVTLS